MIMTSENLYVYHFTTLGHVNDVVSSIISHLAGLIELLNLSKCTFLAMSKAIVAQAGPEIPPIRNPTREREVEDHGLEAAPLGG
jgi:hypothetical protein